ncbi:MAG: CapA family protein [Candidatus Latescibacterota bacterium]
MAEPSLLLCAAGDVALGGDLQARLQEPRARGQTLQAVREVFATSDLRLVDLDCVLDTAGRPPHPEEYLVSARPEEVRVLLDLSVDVACLANNHSTDYGGESLVRTLGHLQQRGVATLGAGADLEEARRPLVVECHGLRVGLLAYASEHPWVGASAAGEGQPGVAPLRPELMAADVRRLRGQVDSVVVCVHWGKEYLHLPPPQSVSLAHSLLEWGADLVLGHHPHVVQGMEEQDGRVIFYSLGNFLYPAYSSQGLRFTGVQQESLVARVRLSRAGARVEELVPVRLGEDGCLARLAGAEADAFWRAFQSHSAAVRRPDYAALWARHVRQHELARLRRVLRREVVEAGWRGALKRILGLRGKNLVSAGRSLTEIVGGARRREE